jgi:hypothetical protein
MSEHRYDFFGEIFQRYFRPAIDAYPRMGGALVESGSATAPAWWGRWSSPA